MKTPDEIKKALACTCDEPDCEKCAYAEKVDDEEFGEMLSFHCSEVDKDALEYIQQLESRLEQVERERDAAVKCLEKVYRTLDKNFPSPDDAVYCTRLAKISISDYMTGDWRGVCDENTKDGEP